MKLFSKKQVISISRADALKLYVDTHSATFAETLKTVIYHVNKVNEYRVLCEKALNGHSISYDRYRTLADDSLRIICLEISILSDKIERYTGTGLQFDLSARNLDERYENARNFLLFLDEAAGGYGISQELAI